MRNCHYIKVWVDEIWLLLVDQVYINIQVSNSRFIVPSNLSMVLIGPMFPSNRSQILFLCPCTRPKLCLSDGSWSTTVGCLRQDRRVLEHLPLQNEMGSMTQWEHIMRSYFQSISKHLCPLLFCCYVGFHSTRKYEVDRRISPIFLSWGTVELDQLLRWSSFFPRKK